MHPKTIRLVLSVVPAVFAFFLVSVFAVALTQNPSIATVIGVVAAVSSSAVIMRH